jgi:hypothetical protein
MGQLWHKTQGLQNLLGLAEQYGTVVKIRGPFNVRSQLVNICSDLIDVGDRIVHLRPSSVAPCSNQRTADLRPSSGYRTVRMSDFRSRGQYQLSIYQIQ